MGRKGVVEKEGRERGKERGEERVGGEGERSREEMKGPEGSRSLRLTQKPVYCLSQ